MKNPPPTIAGSVLRHLSAGISTAVAFGVGLALLLTFLLAREEAAAILIGSWSGWVALFLLIAGVVAAAAAVSLLPLELLLALGGRRWQFWRRLRPGLVYPSVLLAALAFVHATFRINFDLVRDATSARGLIATGVAGFLAVAAVISAALLTRRSDDGVSPTSRSRVLLPLALLLVLNAIGFVSCGVQRGAALPALVGQAASPAVQPEQSGGGERQRPDLILVSIDTVRADHLGSYGYHRATTPHLDGLAGDGARFREARTTAPWTLPSHASMMTGLYPPAHGVRFYTSFRFLQSGSSARLGQSHLTLAEVLRDAGYETAAYTSTTWLTEGFGVMQGFDVLEASIREPSADRIVDQALAWYLREEQTGSPKFLFLHFFDVHDFRSPPEFEARLVPGDYRGKLLEGLVALTSNTFDDLNEDDLAFAMAKYDAALMYVDSELGRLFSALRAAGRFDETLIIVTSDHGEEFWDHGGSGHGFTLYEEQLRVPLIVKLPSSSPVLHREPEVSASLVDVAPTILDYAGFPVEAMPAEGRSLRPYIETDAAPEPRPVFAEATYFFNSYAVVNDGVKYLHHRIPPLELFNPDLLLANIRSFYKFRPPELYRLEVDPRELRNVALEDGASSGEFEAAILAHAAAFGSVSSMDLDEETVERLRSLGYVN